MWVWGVGWGGLRRPGEGCGVHTRNFPIKQGEGEKHVQGNIDTAIGSAVNKRAVPSSLAAKETADNITQRATGKGY